ncbi:MAG: aspartate aminotransferase family protein [Candidatus Eisenbacteria bacterium]
MNPTDTKRPLAEPVRAVPLAMDAAAFRAAGHALVDQLAELLAAIPTGPVTRGESPSVVREALALNAALPEHGTAPGPLLAETARLLFEHSLFNAHPRFMGYITSSPAPIGILGDLLAAAVNPNVGAWVLSPAATEIEAQTVRWISELIGYPTTCGGLLVSGGNMANMVGFWAARAACASWDVRAQGLAAGPRLRVYASAETHTWIHKAADLAGLGTDSVRFVSTGDDLRMDMSELERQLRADRAAGDVPFLVVGTAGSVSTGVIDDLPAIAALAKREQLWFHVDGAYGGFAAAVPGVPSDLLALSGADSVAVDPHKWLYAPLEAGCALVRDPAALTKAFSYHPPYYHFGESATNFVDHGPQNSRGFRALKVWLALRHAGAAGYRRMIADDMALAGVLAGTVKQHPELEFQTHDLSITTWRCVPSDLRARIGDSAVDAYLDVLNKELLSRIQQGGEAFVSNAVIRGRYVLRACIVNFNTRESDMHAVAELSARMGRAIDAELRPAELRARG